jgi:cyanophycinase
MNHIYYSLKMENYNIFGFFCARQGDSVAILGGDSMNALVLGTKFEKSYSGSQSPLVYRKTGGLGFLKNYVLDSHFSDQGREMRLIRTVLDSRDLSNIGTSKGLGVDENTALVVSNPLTKPIGKVKFYSSSSL